jgi:hypothetical protein
VIERSPLPRLCALVGHCVPTRPRRFSGLPRHGLLLITLVVCALVLGSCGNTLQDEPIGPKPLESVLVQSRFPVYWAGVKFHGLPITSVTIDPSQAVTIRYGDCVLGGQYTCVTAISIVTSPDNSFIPGGAAATRAPSLRDATVSVAQGGDTLALATGGVIVSVYADHPALALETARMMAPVNEVGSPLAPLPAALPDTGFERVPLPGQVPAGVSVPRVPSE